VDTVGGKMDNKNGYRKDIDEKPIKWNNIFEKLLIDECSTINLIFPHF